MEWSKALVLEFLDAYEKCPVIWNPHHPNHKNRIALGKAWHNIQSEFPVSVSVIDLKRKKESMMGTYRYMKKKISESDNEYKPAWFAFEKLHSILRSVGETRSEEGSEELSTADDINVYDKKSDEELSDAEEADEISIADNDAQNIVKDEQNVEEPAAATFTNERTAKRTIITGNSPKGNRYKRTRNHMDNSIGRGIQNGSPGLRNILPRSTLSTVRATVRQDPQDDCSLYGQLLATKLREMDARTRAILTNQIDNLVFQTQMNDNYLDCQ